MFLVIEASVVVGGLFGGALFLVLYTGGIDVADDAFAVLLVIIGCGLIVLFRRLIRGVKRGSLVAVIVAATSQLLWLVPATISRTGVAWYGVIGLAGMIVLLIADYLRRADTRRSTDS